MTNCNEMPVMLRSSDGIHNIACYFTKPAGGTPRALLQLSHGMCGHFTRYERFARELASFGIIVFGNDHIGHGLSVNCNEDLGYFGARNGWRYLIDDLHIVNIYAKKMYPELPCIILGHSMGSFIVRGYLSLYPGEVDGAILTGTKGPISGGAASSHLIHILCGDLGKKHRYRQISRAATRIFSQRIGDARTGHDWLSHDSRNVDEFLSDPLCSYEYTLSAYADIMDMLRYISTPQWAESIPKDLPVLLAGGTEDPVGNYGSGVLQVYDMLKQAGCRRVELKIYPACRHELLNEAEPQRDEVFSDFLNFILRSSSLSC